MKNFKGIYPALLTPYDENDKINEKSLEKLIEMNIAKGVNGFYVGGSTGEAFLLSHDERKQVYKLVSEIVNGRVNLIAQVNAAFTETDKDFILSFEKGTPEWNKCSAGDLSCYPSVKWKLQNIFKLKETNPQKYQQGIERLKNFFGK
jgi:hypothetical protein